MNQPVWKFRQPNESEINQDPIEGEFFTTQDVGDLSDALVRESIQNSLDAVIPDKNKIVRPVTVRFFFSGTLEAKNIHINKHPYFSGIYYHLLCADNGLNKDELHDQFSSPTKYIAIEDFGTVGLDGSTIENDDPLDRAPLGHNFYWFWRNIGRTGKKTTERGSWGVGKTVFPASSLINTFFGITSRYDDSKKYLMGLSVLKTHHLNSDPKTKRYPYGYFGQFLDKRDEYFVTPIDDESYIEEFNSTFFLNRSNNSSSGLSIVIPFPRKEITSAAILTSILQQYFHPIIKGTLIVEIKDCDNNINIIVDKTSIYTIADNESLIKAYETRNKLKKIFNLCKWSIEDVEENIIQLTKPPIEGKIQWRKEWFIDENISKKIEKIVREKFENGDKISFRVPIKLQKYNEKPLICQFDVFMEKDENLVEADSYFIRNGITITGVKKPKNKFIRAIVNIEENELVKLLGDAENPAHTEWQYGSSHFRGKYNEGREVISFIERSIDNLSLLLIKQAEGIDRDLLKDIFYLEPSVKNKAEIDEPGADQGDENDSSKTNIDTTVAPFIIKKETGGFNIKSYNESKDYSGTIKIEIAYMVSKGNPLKKYDPLDFDLQDKSIKYSYSGINNLIINKNILTFSIEQNSLYKMALTGFDPERDLFIKATYYDTEI
jgi:hypothetical protein